LSDDTDAELVRRFQSGDTAAFEIFIRRYQDRLHRLAGIFLYDRSLADDAVQEALVRAFTGLSRFRFRSRPFSWLYRVLKNVCSEMNRKKAINTDYDTAAEGSVEDSHSLEHREQLNRVFAMLPGLSRRERGVVLLRVFEEFNERETAVILGVKKGTVKSLLHRGLKKLQSRCGEILENDSQ